MPQTQPVTEPAPATTPDPPPTTDATPTTTESSTPTADTTATTPESEAATTPTTARRSTRTTAAKPTAVPTRSVATRTTATRTIAPTAPAPPTRAPAPAPESAVQPVVDVNTNPAPVPTAAAAKPATNNDNSLPIVAGGALALLALGGGAVALARRRRSHDEEEWIEDEAMASEPVETAAMPEPRHDPIVHEEQPAIVAPAASAFSWGNPQPAQHSPTGVQSSADADDDRMPGESWIERAYRGPTPNNPSVSLRARLKRAAFFDKRERDVAAGRSEPVEMDAGLPEAMVDEQERELA